MAVSKLKYLLSTAVTFFPLVGAACVACFFEALSYLCIRPMSLSRHRQVCIIFSRCFFLTATFLLETWSSVTFKSYGDRIDPKLSYLAVINHRSNVDWLLGLAYVARLGFPYPGNTKCVVKASLGSVPLFGGILRFAEFLFLTRDWATDHKKFLKALLSLRSYAQCGSPMWFVLYPEGTRYTEEKHEYSRRYTESKNLEPHEHVLFPRYKAFTAIVSTLREQFDGILDATFMFEGDEPNARAAFAGTASTIVHAHTKYFPMQDLPEGEEQLENWLLDRWYEKDKRISEFKRDVSSLGPPDPSFFPTTGRPSLHPFYALVLTFAIFSMVTIYALSKIRNGLFILFAFSFSAVSMTVVFVLFNLKPSRKGSGKAKVRR